MYGPNKIIGGKYQLIAQLGSGGFGSVYRAVEIGQEARGEIALKLLLRTPQLKTRDLVRFQREAVLMSQLLHPGVVAVYALGQWEGVFYIAMELVTGSHLEARARKGLSCEESLTITLQVAEILEYVHSHHIVHRDIKPQNILLCAATDGDKKGYQVKLVDFGVARVGYAHLADVGLNLQDEVVGTYGYMAPEATGHRPDWPVDGRSDVYSLGAVLFELLTGTTPFGKMSNETKGLIQCEQPAPALKGGPWPPGLGACLAGALAQNPVDRYQTVAGFLWDLKSLLGGHPIQRPHVKRPSLGQRLGSVLVDREGPLDTLLDTVGRGQNRTRMMWCVVQGSVGMGKTALLHKLRQALEATSTRFLFLRFSPSITHMPYQALTLAVNEYFCEFERYNKAGFEDFLSNCVLKLGSSVHLLAPYFPDIRKEVLRTHGQLSPPEPRALGRGSLEQAFMDLFVSLGRKDIVGRNTAEEPFVFLLDDAHAADGDTLALFQHLTEQVNAASNFHFVMSLDADQAPDSLAQFLDRVSRLRRRFHRVELAPLTLQGLGAWAQAVPMAAMDQGLQELFHKSQGVPKALVRVTLALEREGALLYNEKVWRLAGGVEGTVRGVAVEELLRGLRGMPHDLLETLRWVAVAQGLPPPWMEQALGERVTLGVQLQKLGYLNAQWTFTHERLRAATMAQAPLGWLEAAHTELALRAPLTPQWWETLPQGPWVQWARHAEGANAQLAQERAACLWLAGGRWALDQGDVSKASYYFEKAYPHKDLLEVPVQRALHLFGFHLALHRGHQRQAWAQGRALSKLHHPHPPFLAGIAWGLGYMDKAKELILEGLKPLFLRYLSVLGWLYYRAVQWNWRWVAEGIQWLAHRTPVAAKRGEWAAVLAHEGAPGATLRGLALASGPHRGASGSRKAVGVLLAALWLRFGHIRTAYATLGQYLPEKIADRGPELGAHVWAARYLDEPTGRLERVVSVLGRSRFFLLAQEPGGTLGWRGLAAWTHFLTGQCPDPGVWAWDEGSAQAPVATDIEAHRLCQMFFALFQDDFHLGAHILGALEGLRSSTSLGHALRLCAEGLGALARGNDHRVARRLVKISEDSLVQGPPYAMDALRLSVVLMVLAQRVWAPGAPGSRKGALKPLLKKLSARVPSTKGARRTPVQLLFIGVVELFSDRPREALSHLNSALREARAQKAVVVEMLSGLYLAMGLGGRQSGRALESLEGSLALATTHRWPWAQRLSLGATMAFGLPSVAAKGPYPGGRTLGLGASVAVRSWIQEAQAVPPSSRESARTGLLHGALKTACEVVRSPMGALFVAQTGHRFSVLDTWGGPGESSLNHVAKCLSKSAETPIKLLSLALENGAWVAQTQPLPSQLPTQIADHLPTQTQPLGADPTATGRKEPSEPSQGMWLLVALPLSQGGLGGWLALQWLSLGVAPSAEQETELQLLASHVGSLLPLASPSSMDNAAAPEVPPWQGPVPRGVWWESQGDCQRHQGQVGWRGVGLSPHSFLLGAWNLPGALEKGGEWVQQAAATAGAWPGAWGPLASRLGQDILDSLATTSLVTALGDIRWDLLLVHRAQGAVWRITVGQELFVQVGDLGPPVTEVTQEMVGGSAQRLVCRTTHMALGEVAVWAHSPLFWDAPFLRAWTLQTDFSGLARALGPHATGFAQVVGALGLEMPKAWGQGGCVLGVVESWGL